MRSDSPRRLDFFPADYFAACDRFRALAAEHGGRVEPHVVTAAHPDSLTVDAAYFGGDSPRRLMIVTSGIHGVEGFGGSAVQQQFVSGLDPHRDVPPGCGILLAHALNPYGFVHLRRANENNVDLNRNCLADFPGPANPEYRALDPLLNPRRPAGSPDFFLPRLWAKGVLMGARRTIQGIAGGQYEFPQGLFYGGDREEPSVRIFREIVSRPMFSDVTDVLHIDLHSGLGKHGEAMLLTDCPEASPEFERFAGWFGRQPVRSGASASYASSGDLLWLTPRCFSGRRVSALTFEFGTYPMWRVLSVLRRENQLHHFGCADARFAQAIRKDMLETFCPESPAWRLALLESGRRVFESAMQALFAGQGNG